MAKAADLSMNEMPIHDHHQDWSDEHITVKFVNFNPSTGEAHFQVAEHHDNAGFYYVWIHYGDQGISQHT